ncbi:MAG: hypothetical protein IPQ13_03070 [Holophagaceae bacterium]|nr:hypothetical protein [Holophagaceae bacterium]
MSAFGFDTPRPAQLRRFGFVFYTAGLRMQKALAEYVADPGNPDQLVMLSHNPVFTLGRNASAADIHVSAEFCAQQGVEIQQTDRGARSPTTVLARSWSIPSAIFPEDARMWAAWSGAWKKP